MLNDLLVYPDLFTVYVMSILLTAVMMIITVVSQMTIAFQIIYNLRSEDQAKSLKLIYKILLSIAVLACVVFACVSSVYVFDRIADLAETNTVIKKLIEEVYDVTKTGNQLIFNRKIDNRSFVKDSSSAITNETDTHYTIVRHEHVYQIQKSIVTEK